MMDMIFFKAIKSIRPDQERLKRNPAMGTYQKALAEEEP